jgi:CRISPR system Cascade subunit CasC
MFIEIHLIQNFAPSNLNRDESNAPKDCEFGGYRRARISSQCLKRAARTYFKSKELLPAADLAVRTKRLMRELTDRLIDAGKPADQAEAVAGATIGGLGLAPDKKKPDQTQYALFLGAAEVRRLVDICLEHWEALSGIVPTGDGKGTAKQAKKQAETAVGSIAGEFKRALDGGRAADLALFGRMLADIPERNVEAACQVAHALSTHRVNMEFDFYTAVDDLQPEDTAGATMMGTVEFNSSCFYRYANIDLGQLLANLQGDQDLARQTVRAFLEASIYAIPTGKQNSMAAHNRPSLVVTVIRSGDPCSLANAFAEPVRPGEQQNLVTNSIRALDVHWNKLTRMYGAEDIVALQVCSLDDAGLHHLAEAQVPSIPTLIDGTVSALSFTGAAA